MLRAFLFVALMLAVAPAPAHAQSAAPDPLAPATSLESIGPEPTEEEIAAFVADFEASLNRQTGVIAIPRAHVTLNVPEGFFFLDATDASRILVDLWGNPPDSTVDGMLFPKGASPFQESGWGVVITYEDAGYVSDEDATSIDYDMLIDAMRQASEEENPTRVRQGYPAIDVIGWAAQPRYDAAAHKLYWAKELAFAGEPEHTLNYDMRVLGRHGVLSLNFVADLGQLHAIEQVSPAVLAIADFDQGFRYTDFNASTDAKADFGLAGLIGGAAAASVLAKNGGLIAAALLFLKKGWVLIFAAIAGLGALARKFFGRKPKAQQRAEQRMSTDFFDGPAQDQTTQDQPANDQAPTEPDSRPPGAV